MKKYNDLSKEEKKKIKKDFWKTKKGKEMLPILNRLFIEGLICLISAVVILVCSFIFDLEWWYYFALGSLSIGGVLFLVAQFNIRQKEFNKFINMKKSKKI